MGDQDPLPEFRRERLDECRGRTFARRTFASAPELRTLGPGAWDEDGTTYHVSAPYTGQDYDPARYELVEGGWDHEHCHVCDARIGSGDSYYWSGDPWPLELCPACHGRLDGHPG